MLVRQIIVNIGGIIMKKYVTLFSFTFLIIGFLFCVGKYYTPKTIEVETTCLEPKVAQEFILCSGKIEYTDGEKVYVKSPSILEDLFVKVGDKVKKGDVVARTCKITANSPLDSPQYMKYLEDNKDLKEVYSSFIKNKVSLDNNQKCVQKESSEIEEIKAPISGIVSSVNAKSNLPLDNGFPVISISKDKSFIIRLNINEAKVAQIKKGQKVIITGVGFKDQVYDGYIDEISNEAKKEINLTDTETTVEVIVRLNSNENQKNIKPGFTAKCKIITNQQNDVPIITYKSVCQDNFGREYIYKYNKGRAQKAYIKTGKEYDEGYELISGASIGDIIVDSPENVKENCIIKMIEREE